MKTLGFRLALVGLVLGAVAYPATGTICILVDEIHGRPLSSDLAEALPHCEITALTPADFPITAILDEGHITDSQVEWLFTVPQGADCLYLRFTFSDCGLQLPFITLYGPGETRIGSHCEGALHVEDPAPGEYRLTYSTWVSTVTDYVIGTGPHLLSSGVLDGCDLICNLWDDTMLMFRGELPPYSAHDQATYGQFLEDGGGFLYVREPLIEIALKPIINIYAGQDVACDVDLGFPGRLTFADPPCQTEAVSGGTWLRWHDLSVSAGQPAQILYEGKLSHQTRWLAMTAQGDAPDVRNRTDHPLSEVHLIRHEGNDLWRLVRVGTLASGTEVATSPGDFLDGSALKTTLENIVRNGGRKAGLYEDEIEEFLARYHWADRWLVQAAEDGEWCGLFRIGEAAYDAHIPFQGSPPANEVVRTMWIWATGLGESPLDAGPEILIWPPTEPGIGSDGPIVYHEYGVQYQRGSAASIDKARNFGFLDWTFYDGGALVDPTNNCGEPECPWFSWTGGHPEADKFMTGVSTVVGHYPGTLTAPWWEQILIGDDDAYTDDWMYPPGTYPPVAAAKSVGLGRAATIHTLSILGDYQDNRVFLGNVVDWLAQYPSPAPDFPPAVSRITRLAPNPFNPRLTIDFLSEGQQPVTLTVCDLAGKRVATLAHEVFTEGEHQVIWNGQDDAGRDLPSGGYLIRLETQSGHQTRKATLVR